jgi:hypothetical protein
MNKLNTKDILTPIGMVIMIAIIYFLIGEIAFIDDLRQLLAQDRAQFSISCERLHGRIYKNGTTDVCLTNEKILIVDNPNFGF